MSIQFSDVQKFCQRYHCTRVDSDNINYKLFFESQSRRDILDLAEELARDYPSIEIKEDPQKKPYIIIEKNEIDTKVQEILERYGVIPQAQPDPSRFDPSQRIQTPDQLQNHFSQDIKWITPHKRDPNKMLIFCKRQTKEAVEEVLARIKAKGFSSADAVHLSNNSWAIVVNKSDFSQL